VSMLVSAATGAVWLKSDSRPEGEPISGWIVAMWMFQK